MKVKVSYCFDGMTVKNEEYDDVISIVRIKGKNSCVRINTPTADNGHCVDIPLKWNPELKVKIDGDSKED